MKIAVASMDGASVASSLDEARCLVIFQALDNVVEQVEIRPEGSVAIGAAVRLVGITGAAAADETIKIRMTDEGAGALARVDDGLPDELIREMLDCQMVLAGGFTARQERDLRRLGMMVLPGFAQERAENAVRFVISGTPPREGEACGPCPRRAVRIGSSRMPELSEASTPVLKTESAPPQLGANEDKFTPN